MEINGKSIWQVAAGDTDREYSKIFLKWDVILIGSGRYGRWPNQDYNNSKNSNELKRFCEGVKDQDLVVLRSGTNKVLAVGEVVGDYEWYNEFGDVDGWNLEHTRRVRWLWTEGVVFPTYSLKWGGTISSLDSQDIKLWLSNLTITEESYKRELIKLPFSKKDSRLDLLDLNQISEHLFDKGIASNSIENLLHEMGGLIRVAKWYDRVNIKPSEDETRAYLVIPLLRALGWTQQRMAIEWHNIDVALFSEPLRNENKLSAVVEAKRKDNSCLNAQLQAEDYAKNKKTCKRLIVTDGLRYGVFIKASEQFKLSAYMNLTRLIDKYPIYECGGAADLLSQITPEFNDAT